MEKEKVVLPKFNVETYLKDGDAVEQFSVKGSI